ncbi:MAG: hypothetical protein JSW52_05100 [Candidatus Coatesbacteria bacterium]|nr:MAG: hypothetical protein JSW52_05100 [Candidatus Coatesbacteria bacterium]
MYKSIQILVFIVCTFFAVATTCAVAPDDATLIYRAAIGGLTTPNIESDKGAAIIWATSADFSYARFEVGYSFFSERDMLHETSFSSVLVDHHWIYGGFRFLDRPAWGCYARASFNIDNPRYGLFGYGGLSDHYYPGFSAGISFNPSERTGISIKAGYTRTLKPVFEDGPMIGTNAFIDTASVIINPSFEYWILSFLGVGFGSDIYYDFGGFTAYGENDDKWPSAIRLTFMGGVAVDLTKVARLGG